MLSGSTTSRVNASLQAVDDAVRKLIRATHTENGSHVTMPLRYPSGASVVLEITQTESHCFVSDMGLGFLESEMIGATRPYGRHARLFAEDAGIRYDGRSFLVAEVPAHRLAGAMTIIAEGSQKCAAFAALKVAERLEADIKQVVYDRMTAMFGAGHVRRDMPFMGASGHEWKVPLLVDLVDGRAIVEAVYPHSASVAFTVMRLGDIGRLDAPPPRLVVVDNKRRLGDLLNVVSPVSTAVIEVADARSTYEQFMVAA